MIYSDTILEKEGFFLRNLITNYQNTGLDIWSNASSSYGFYSCPYEYPLGASQLYYVRYTYKFTTTNQSPTWVQFFIQGGSNPFIGAKINNPVANTEYTVSGISSIAVNINNLTSGTIYHGYSNAINGVSACVKNVMFYDVTELFTILKQAGVVSTNADLKTWCDNNLVYSPRYTNYDITNLLTSAIEKIAITEGSLIGDSFVETDGLDFYATSTSIRNHKYFDSGSALSVYNNSGNGTVTHARVDAKAQNSPFWQQHPYVLQITTNGTASPGAGGFVCAHMAAADRIVVEKFVAKIPVGYNVTQAYNTQGTGSSVTFLSSSAGTGDWAEYTILYKCGNSGSFSSGGHVYITGSNNTSVTWYVAYCISCIITDAEYLKNFTVLNNIERIKSGAIFSRHFDTMNLFPAGNGGATIALPFGWEYDSTDVAGDAIASFVQPVGKGTGVLGDYMTIYPGQQYKISYWIKCKQDMSSFLTAILPYTSTKALLTHTNVSYVSGTKTKLASQLNTGDTTVSLTSSANWVVRKYSKLGFRSSNNKSYNDIGTSNASSGSGGIISSVSGNTLTLATAYTGANRASGTVIVESFDGVTYPYPIQKGNLPTDNTWKYVEGYFSSQALWDGAGGGWISLPYDAIYIKLQINLYTNDGTVPIKYSDIRIEPVKAGSGDRNENKIDIIRGN